MPKSIHTPAYRRLCHLLVTAREEASLTQMELAEKLDRPQSFVSKYERAERRLDVVELMQISEALGIDASSLLRRLEKG